jgi:hypothetical protein
MNQVAEHRERRSVHVKKHNMDSLHSIAGTALLSLLLLSCSSSAWCNEAGAGRHAHQPAIESCRRWHAFWSDFREAVRHGDRKKLYAMTIHSGFSWEMDPPLDLPLQKGAMFLYDIPDRESFERVCTLIFSKEIRKTVIASKFYPDGSGGYSLYHFTRANEIFALAFRQTLSGEFRFTGSYYCHQ